MSPVRIIAAPTVTSLPPDCAGSVLVTGSHGGVYPGRLAARAGLRAAIFHDAGIGLQEAGIGALGLLEALGIPAAAVSHLSARVGDTEDMLARGVISRTNAPAQQAGIEPGMGCEQAASLLLASPWRKGTPPQAAEGRRTEHPEGANRPLVLVDSAALVDPVADRGAVVVTGSHGGLVGGDPAKALRAEGFAAAYNDAGIGIDQAGIARLPALDARGIAAITVAASSARIGEAQSTLWDGIISAANARAMVLGARVGAPAGPLLLAWTRLPAQG
jgi:hypothetical protein